MRKYLSWLTRLPLWVGVISFFAFFALRFHYSDLSDLVAGLISKNTGGQIYVQFEELSPNPLWLSLTMHKVSVEAVGAPKITMGRLSVSPKIFPLLIGRLGGQITAQELFTGSLNLDVIQRSDPGQKGNSIFEIEMDSAGLELSELTEALPFAVPVPLEGKLNLSLSVAVDPTMKTSPRTLGESEVILTSSTPIKIKAHTANIPTDIGPVSLSIPEIKLSTVSFRGRMNEGKIDIIEMTLGDEKKDPLHLQAKGDLGLQFGGARARVNLERYDVKARIDIKNETLEGILGPYAALKSMAESYKSTSAPDRSAYMVGVQGTANSLPRARRITTL